MSRVTPTENQGWGPEREEEPDSPEIARNLRFRDRLRADRADRELYERTKRQLAARDWTYMQQYADAKGEVVEAIMRRAEAAGAGAADPA